METMDIENGGHNDNGGILFKNISKSVSLSPGYQHQILYNVSGKCSSQEMMAIMGRSGSGKTSLLQTLGGRSTMTMGQVLINGETLSQSKRSDISFVWQDDVFYPSMSFTVRDQLLFEAYVKMHASTTQETLLESVDDVMKQMQIEHCADTSLYLISGGERRRTSIAKELLSDPQVLLMDEGTSGLDSAAAFDLLVKLKSLALVKKIPIISVIHQPSSRAFYLFDLVLVMSEGCCVYRGAPKRCMEYLAGAGITLPEAHCNPADFMLDLLFSQEIDADSGMCPRYMLFNAWVKSEDEGDFAERIDEVTCIDDEVLVTPGSNEYLGSSKSKHSSCYTRQVYAVMIRSAKAGFEVEFGRVNVLQTLFMAVLAGLCWFQTPHVENRISDLAGFVLFVIAYWFFAGMFEGMLDFLPERVVLRRELASGDYPLSAYFLAKTLASTPVRVLLPWTFLTISYCMVDARPSGKVYAALSALVVLATLVGTSIGTCIGCLTEDYHVAASLTTVASLSMLIVGGFYRTELPHWISFVGYLSAFRYSYRAAIQVMFGFSREFECSGGYWVRQCAASPLVSVSNAQVVSSILGDDVECLVANILVLILFFFVFRVLAYCSLLHAERKILW